MVTYYLTYEDRYDDVNTITLHGDESLNFFIKRNLAHDLNNIPLTLSDSCGTYYDLNELVEQIRGTNGGQPLFIASLDEIPENEQIGW